MSYICILNQKERERREGKEREERWETDRERRRETENGNEKKTHKSLQFEEYIPKPIPFLIRFYHQRNWSQ